MESKIVGFRRSRTGDPIELVEVVELESSGNHLRGGIAKAPLQRRCSRQIFCLSSAQLLGFGHEANLRPLTSYEMFGFCEPLAP